MGGHPYQYVVDYSEDIPSALDTLRRQVFERGEFHGSGRGAKTPEEALELAGETGTRSILDIMTIQDEPDLCCAAPLTPGEMTRFFGTVQPSVRMVEESDDFWDHLERGMARYVVIYENGKPTKLFFAGYSFD